MKYLKYFENNNNSNHNIEDHIDEVKSVLYDIIDNYDIEEIPDDLDENDHSRPGIYYYIYGGISSDSDISIIFYCPTDWFSEILDKYFILIKKEIPILAERLRRMGYDVKYDIPEDIKLTFDEEIEIKLNIID